MQKLRNSDADSFLIGANRSDIGWKLKGRGCKGWREAMFLSLSDQHQELQALEA
jgi:hypothetical protein